MLQKAKKGHAGLDDGRKAHAAPGSKRHGCGGLRKCTCCVRAFGRLCADSERTLCLLPDRREKVVGFRGQCGITYFSGLDYSVLFYYFFPPSVKTEFIVGLSELFFFFFCSYYYYSFLWKVSWGGLEMF